MHKECLICKKEVAAPPSGSGSQILATDAHTYSSRHPRRKPIVPSTPGRTHFRKWDHLYEKRPVFPTPPQKNRRLKPFRAEAIVSKHLPMTQQFLYFQETESLELHRKILRGSGGDSDAGNFLESLCEAPTIGCGKNPAPNKYSGVEEEQNAY